MKRLVLLAAAALLGSGCIVHNDTCDQATITVAWNTSNGFTLGDGSAMGCAGVPDLNILPVAWVDIYMDGALVDSWNCGDGGAVITNVASGTYRLTVEGIDTTGRIAYRDEFNAAANSCGDRFYQAQPAEGFVNVNYAFEGGDDCLGDPSYMWFSVWDAIAAATAAEVSERTPAFESLYWCDVPPYSTVQSYVDHALYIPLPAGTYTMRWIEERTLSSATYSVAGANCSPFDFTVVGGQAINAPSTPIVLANTSSACAHP